MTLKEIADEIDKVIALLQKARATLLPSEGEDQLSLSKLKRRPITQEGRAKIAAVQKARWAKVRKAMNNAQATRKE